MTNRHPLPRVKILTSLIATLFCAGPLAVQAAPGYTDLMLPGNGAATGVSADGNVVSVGEGSVGGNTAYRWTAAGGLQNLGTLGGPWARAAAVSGDGSALVGMASDGGAVSAFRWTQAGGMEDLGMLPGDFQSHALGVNGNGSVVVGQSIPMSVGAQAFRWTQAGGMVGLGMLNGGSASQANGVSADGNVVVGGAGDGAAGDAQRAFLWTQAGGMQSLGVLNGGLNSRANGVSADGNVVVGTATDGAAGNNNRAFRWTQAGGMQSLGTLNGGHTSIANAANDVGSVVVGRSTDGAAGNASRAFRWTQAGGMQTVEAWLAASGVPVAAGVTTYSANGVSADGNVVVGEGPEGNAFIARSGAGLVTLADLSTSLASTAPTTSLALEAGKLVLHGAHGHPLDRRVAEGRKHCAWLAGDWGQDDHSTRDGTTGLAEVGGCFKLGEGWQANLALGATRERQRLLLDGKVDFDGAYLLGELMGRLGAANVWGTLTGYYHDGSADVRRGYLNAGLPDASSGSTDASTWALEARVDWENAARLGKLDLTPFAKLTTAHTRIDAYTETGGGFPAAYNARNEQQDEVRLGVLGILPINATLRFDATLEGVHSFDGAGTPISGTVPGIGAFTLPGTTYDRDWVHVSAGIKKQLGEGHASLRLGTTSQGQFSNFWLAAAYQRDF